VNVASAGWSGNNPGPGTVLHNALIPVYRCPSSSTGLPEFARASNPGGLNWMVSDYTGIGGIGAQLIPGYTESRFGISPTSGCCFGISCGGGLLFPNSNIKMGTGIPDGSSNVIMVSEQSDVIVPGGGPAGIKDYRSSSNHGFAIGVSSTAIGH